jgi:hypothetical protein
MRKRDCSALLRKLGEAYAARSARSAAWNERALACLVDGGSHANRLMEPFPPRIACAQGAWLREEGIYARCTGYPNDVLPGSSLAQVNFPYAEGDELLHPEDVNDPTRCDVVLRDRVFRLAMLLEEVNVAHGLGALSTAHGGRDVELLAEACRRAGRRIKGYL